MISESPYPSIVLCTPWTRRTGFRIAPEETPVLQIPTMSGRFTHITKAKFTTFFKNSLTSIGLDPTLFSVRSFRHGSIHETMLVQENMGLVSVSLDHSTNAIMAYISVPVDRHNLLATESTIWF